MKQSWCSESSEVLATSSCRKALPPTLFAGRAHGTFANGIFYFSTMFHGFPRHYYFEDDTREYTGLLKAPWHFHFGSNTAVQAVTEILRRRIRLILPARHTFIFRTKAFSIHALTFLSHAATSPAVAPAPTDDDTKSLQYCQDVATKISSVKDLPASCKKYPEVMKTLMRRTTTKDDATIAFQGMRPGSAAQARAARAKGQEHHAQIQRRYTRTETARKNSKRSSA